MVKAFLSPAHTMKIKLSQSFRPQVPAVNPKPNTRFVEKFWSNAELGTLWFRCWGLNRDDGNKDGSSYSTYLLIKDEDAI